MNRSDHVRYSIVLRPTEYYMGWFTIQDGTTPLFSAVSSNAYEVVHQLIQKGAHINITRVWIVSLVRIIVLS